MIAGAPQQVATRPTTSAVYSETSTAIEPGPQPRAACLNIPSSSSTAMSRERPDSMYEFNDVLRGAIRNMPPVSLASLWGPDYRAQNELRKRERKAAKRRRKIAEASRRRNRG